MRCDECRQQMREFLDGEAGDRRRREVGLHLAECEECAALIEQDRFWDRALRRHLDHELPPDLRSEILGDLVGVPERAGGMARNPRLGWKQQWKVVWWSLKRDFAQPWKLVPAVVAAIAVILFVNWFAPARTPEDDSFRTSAPVVELGPRAVTSPDETVSTARITLSGRLI